MEFFINILNTSFIFSWNPLGVLSNRASGDISLSSTENAWYLKKFKCYFKFVDSTCHLKYQHLTHLKSSQTFACSTSINKRYNFAHFSTNFKPILLKCQSWVIDHYCLITKPKLWTQIKLKSLFQLKYQTIRYCSFFSNIG